jgi:hypothetical protein
MIEGEKDVRIECHKTLLFTPFSPLCNLRKATLNLTKVSASTGAFLGGQNTHHSRPPRNAFGEAFSTGIFARRHFRRSGPWHADAIQICMGICISVPK